MIKDLISAFSSMCIDFCLYIDLHVDGLGWLILLLVL